MRVAVAPRVDLWALVSEALVVPWALMSVVLVPWALVSVVLVPWVLVVVRMEAKEVVRKEACRNRVLLCLVRPCAFFPLWYLLQSPVCRGQVSSWIRKRYEETTKSPRRKSFQG